MRNTCTQRECMASTQSHGGNGLTNCCVFRIVISWSKLLHLTFSFYFSFEKKKKKPRLVSDQKLCCGSTHSVTVRGEGAVLEYNFIRINHNLHDFSVIHWHLKLNFIDAWREPSLRGSASPADFREQEDEVQAVSER